MEIEKNASKKITHKSKWETRGGQTHREKLNGKEWNIPKRKEKRIIMSMCYGNDVIVQIMSCMEL